MLHCLSAKLSTIVKSLCIARVLRHFVLVPHEICVVPFGHWKIAPDRNDISIANRESIVKSLTHACASLRSFKHGYLSLQKCSLFSRIFGESSTISISHVAKLVTNRVSLLNRRADVISLSIRLATIAFARRFAPSNAAAGQPGPLLVIRWLQAEKRTIPKGMVLFSNRQLSILPGRFQPSTFDV